MVAHLNRFLSSGAGLEKTLRLTQSVAQIAAVFSVGSTAVRFTTAKLQLALTRRFFRFFGFIESFSRVSTLLSKDGMSSVPGWLDLAKWTCFGLYFLLEDLTILHAMDVYLVPWEARVMKEANTFWFYALSFSLAGAFYGLLFSASADSAPKAKDQKEKKNGTKAEKEKPEPVANEKANATKTTALVRQIVVEGCDLVLPITLLSWVHTPDLVVGLTMVVSTVLTGREIWKKV
ncbi:hypothetical protein PMG11_00036 [Penicillium brasilianum]|uniref:PEX11 domain protein n=1 Tax=Penicillium brasilianum TaxID=104259 RepID=A0A0F7TCY5_PENBI|nr:hypothetical protein PMG11_00036 [Penicillium brasilianum]